MQCTKYNATIHNSDRYVRILILLPMCYVSRNICAIIITHCVAYILYNSCL